MQRAVAVGSLVTHSPTYRGMKGGGSAMWSLMWKYCISVRTLRYQGICVANALPTTTCWVGASGRQAGQFP